MKKQGLILIASLLLSAPVFAQDSDTLITPTSGWLVGPALVSESADGTTPCLMANSFSNNFEIRFSGGGENILAMAVNVHRPTFEAGSSYLITLGVAEGEGVDLPAQAFSADTVIVDMKLDKGFYQNLKKAQSLFVKLGDNQMEFSMLGVGDGLKRMESCFSPSAKPASAASAGHAVEGQHVWKADSGTVTAAQAEPSPGAGSAIPGIRKLDMALASPQTAAGQEAAEDHADTGSALPPVDGDMAVSPNAPAPNPVHSQEVAAPGDDAGPVIEDVADQNAPDMNIPKAVAPAVPEPQAAPVEAKPDILLPPAGQPAARASAPAQQMRWRVMKGANLRGILDVWAKSAQAQLVWQSDQDFSVLQSVAQQDTFEGIVQTLLAQYPDDQPRPFGKIHVDPATGQKTLVIEADKPAVSSADEGNYAPIIAP